MRIIRNIKPEFIDERGGITRLLDSPYLDSPIKSILHITCKAGSIRSNHYHKKDSHWCYILSGKAEWYQRPVEGDETEKEILNAGDMVYDPPNVIHAGRFLEDTVELVFCTEPRNQDNYEADTIKFKLI